MYTYLKGAVLALALLVAAPAFAASISNPLFSNGQTAIDATGGSTVSGTFTLTVGPGEVVEWLRTQSDPSQPFVDTDSNKVLGYQEQVYTNVPFSVKVPPNTGTYYPTVQGAGIFGGGRSINGADNVTLSSTNLGTVRVVANATSASSDPTLGSSEPSWLASLIALLKPAPTPAPATSAVCASYATAKVGAVQWTNSDANVALQGFLLSQHASIPALKAGAAFGYYGPQTSAAVAWFNASNHCE